ncbi:hypothetical protein IFM89_018788 [Coptis chinensis]|uniref:Uncharacterized protein n=1 Tax=Coptis chinensis TaxID=261450 RepID=A0A835I3E3_9MAGN|nr:hypothetical protein IFM89_018788 [Coptis chinensis]
MKIEKERREWGTKVRKRGKEVAIEKPRSSKKGKEVPETTKKGKETVKSGTTEVNNEANQEANQVPQSTTVRKRENKAPSSNVGEGTPTVSKRGKRAASTTVEKPGSSKKGKETVKSGTTDDVPQGVGASKRKTRVKGRKDHVPEGVGVFTTKSGNSYLKMSSTGAPILINEAKISEANNKRKGRPPLPRRSSKAPVIGLQSNQVSSETVPTGQVASSNKPKTRSAASLETHHQAVASRNSQSLTTDAVASSSKPRNSPSKTKRKTFCFFVENKSKFQT